MEKQAPFPIGMSESKATAVGALKLSSTTRPEGKDARIIGIDNNPECKKFENEEYEIIIGSQSDPFFWKKFYENVGNVDIILDDGGHTNEQQIITLIESNNYINDGGLHVVEDTHTSYQKHYGNPYKYSFMNFSKKTKPFFNVFARFWGPGVVLNRPGMLKNPGGLDFSPGARSWSGFVSIGQVGQKSAPQNMSRNNRFS